MAIMGDAHWLALALAAYLIGAIPFGLVIGRLRGVDLRSLGSGNIGATNAVRAMGRRWGIVVFALDAAKAAGPVLLFPWWLAQQGHDVLEGFQSGLAVITVTGHIFPVYLRFRGGKGVACAFGAFAALSPWVAVAAGIIYLQVLVLTRISGLGSLTATVVMVLGAWLHGDPTHIRLAALGVCVLIWIRHRANLQDLLREASARRSLAQRDAGNERDDQKT